jgi:hypothetical protein
MRAPLGGVLGDLDRHDVGEVHRGATDLGGGAPGEAQRGLDQRGHRIDVLDQPVPTLRLGHALCPQAHARQVGLEVVRDGADQHRALTHQPDDALLHRLYGLRETPDLRGALAREGRLRRAAVEPRDCLGKAAQGAEFVPRADGDEAGDGHAQHGHPQAQRLA